ncbi:Protein lin-7 B [Thelohanellus kitauei]|uniref:Protein lin-7 B n=1 Tax=Thelohanellus kitauei TaxID=669202 RepID=A0A0C2NC96_THEKT|nr:Protein lin-7 B [Thelohanellus kitauei]
MTTIESVDMPEAVEGEISRDLAVARSLLHELISDGHDTSGSLKELLSVLESPSFNCVKNVFETLYLSFNTKMNTEDSLISARKGTVAAFTASQKVAVRESTEGLGFNILGGKEQNTAVFISKILRGGASDQYYFC